LNLNECVAIYAGGSFGEICELYIEPQHRSASVGAILLDEAKVFARKKGWSCIEVGAPSEENWPRTVGFYLKNGFNVIGPRLEISISAA
jgi:ribosomal protein S18 acetylase RimI-like enzyme